MKRSSFVFLSVLYFLPYVFIATVLIYFLVALIHPLFSNIPVVGTAADSIARFFSSIIMAGGEPNMVGALLFIPGMLLPFAVYKSLDWPSRISHLCGIAACIGMALTNGYSAFFWFACLFIISLIIFSVLHIHNYFRLLKREQINRH